MARALNLYRGACRWRNNRKISKMVTTISPKFAKELAAQPSLKVATVAAGCFWGVEHIYRKHFLNEGLIDTAVGYTGGTTSDPTYREVCSKDTYHAEGLQILFNPAKLSYEKIIDFFFRIHDPTTLNRQGPDQGTQYRSAIFTHDESQSAIAHKTREEFQKSFWKDQIKTHIEPIQNWWDAEQYHQLYLDKNPDGYECPTHYVRTSPQL